MPDENNGPESVSPAPEGAKPAPESPAAKSDADAAKSAESKPAVPAEKPADAAAKPAAPEAKSPDAPAKPAAPPAKPADAAAKPAAPAAAKPAAPAGAKPAAPAAAKPAAPAKPTGPVPQPWDSPLVTSLKQQYGSGVKEANTYVGQKYLVVEGSILFDVLRRMAEDESYDYCVDITAVHWPKREQPFDIVYILYSFHHNDRVRIKAQIADGQHLQSAVNLWPTVNWLEREVFDMFGIVFDGHPDLKRILMPDGWQGYPLRKDYDILQQDTEWVKINLGIESGQ